MRRRILPARLLVVVLSLGLLTPAAAVVTFSDHRSDSLFSGCYDVGLTWG